MKFTAVLNTSFQQFLDREYSVDASATRPKSNLRGVQAQFHQTTQPPLEHVRVHLLGRAKHRNGSVVAALVTIAFFVKRHDNRSAPISGFSTAAPSNLTDNVKPLAAANAGKFQ